MGKKVWPGGGTLPEVWRKPLEKIADWVPVDFLLAWIDVESNGRPDVTTSLGERGLFQVHPDEREFLGLTEDQFQALTTDTDLALRTGVKQAKLFAYQAKKALNAVGEDWHGRDFWKVVKMYHGAFGMPNNVINAFQRVKGKGPGDWDELMAFALDQAQTNQDLVPDNAKLSATLRGLTPSVFNNAQKTGEESELPVVIHDRVSVVAPLLRNAGLMV